VLSGWKKQKNNCKFLLLYDTPVNLKSRKMPKVEIEVGDRFMVKWRNGQLFPGDIVELRRIKKKENEFEFYIHYVNFDRRLDEWVTIDRIDTTTPLSSTADHSEGKNRKGKRRFDDIDKKDPKDEKEFILSVLEKENEEITKVKNIQSIVLGKYEIETWYFSPFPEDYCGEDRLYVCEYCLKYMKKQKTLVNHMHKCHLSSPPGRLIYLEDNLSMYEIDGREHKLYCQNLCLLSKLFLDHKTLYYDVDPFMFYVLCEYDTSHHIVGYFSKEKQSQESYNLACILTFPPYQRKGYGKFLISVSYEISKREGLIGSPEKPLSDLGRISYRSYWAYVILNLFQKEENLMDITIEKISKITSIRIEDILSTLHSLNMIKYWKGQHVVTINKHLIINILTETKKLRLCNPSCLTWQPSEKGGCKQISRI
jgi:histone acetyltransferase MYST1